MSDPVSNIDCGQFVELVTGFLDGALDRETERRVAAHLPDCAGCEGYLDQMRRTVRALGDLPAQPLSEDARNALLAEFRG